MIAWVEGGVEWPKKLMRRFGNSLKNKCNLLCGSDFCDLHVRASGRRHRVVFRSPPASPLQRPHEKTSGELREVYVSLSTLTSAWFHCCRVTGSTGSVIRITRRPAIRSPISRTGNAIWCIPTERSSRPACSMMKHPGSTTCPFAGRFSSADEAWMNPKPPTMRTSRCSLQKLLDFANSGRSGAVYELLNTQRNRPNIVFNPDVEFYFRRIIRTDIWLQEKTQGHQPSRTAS